MARLISTPAQKATHTLTPQQATKLANARAVHEMATKGHFNGSARVKASRVGSSSGIGAALAGSAFDALSSPPRQDARKAAPPPKFDPRVDALPGLSDNEKRLLDVLLTSYEAAREPIDFTAMEAASLLGMTTRDVEAARNSLQARSHLVTEVGGFGNRIGYRVVL